MANKLRQQQVVCGYDYVIPTQDETTRVYWVPSATLPLAIVSLQLHLKCNLCLEYKLYKEGCQCPAKLQHFVCWECFG